MVFVLLIWLWTVRHLLPTEKLLHRGMTAYVLGCAVSGFVAVLQLSAHVLVSLGTLTNGRASGLAKAPDDTGSLLALGLTFAVGLALHPAVKRRWLYVSSIAVIATGLIISGSVSGMLCGLIGAVVVILRFGVKLKHVLAVGVLLIAVYGLGTAIQAGHGGSLNPIARFTGATSSGSQNNSVNDREGTWKNSWSGIVHNPWVGHGLDVESSLVYEDPNDYTWYPPHNFILMNWYQGGILFLIGDFVCIFTALLRTRRNGVMDATKNVLFAGMVAVFAFSMQAPTMYDRYFWFPFVLAMALPPAAIYRSRRRQARELSLAAPDLEASKLQPST
jgi:O-antigen ligase